MAVLSYCGTMYDIHHSLCVLHLAQEDKMTNQTNDERITELEVDVGALRVRLEELEQKVETLEDGLAKAAFLVLTLARNAETFMDDEDTDALESGYAFLDYWFEAMQKERGAS
jgi:ABC-type uncharacterized transport system ATPase component